MKMNMFRMAVASVMSSVLSTQATFTVSLELQGGECSDQLTLICRHSDDGSPPVWIHNGTLESGEVLATAFPGAVYTVPTRTEHTTTITGVDNVRALDGYVFHCAYEDLGILIKSNAVKYSFIPPDFQPKLKKTDVVQSFSERFCTLNYELEAYAEGIAKCRSCAGQFSVNFTVAPNAYTSSISTDAVAQCNITNLERCKVYDIFARSYRGDQVLDTVYDVDSVMTTPGAFNVSNVTFVSSRVVHITIEEVSPDCDSFQTLWYYITIKRGDGASKQMKQVEANDFPPLNDSVVTITVIFDTPLPQGTLNVEVLKVNAVPVKKMNEKGTPVETQTFQNWNSSSKATVFNPHTPPPTMAEATVQSNAADPSVVITVVAAVLVVCGVGLICCVAVLCVCMICCRGRKSTQGYYTIGKPSGALNTYETVHHEVLLGRGEEEHVVDAEAGSNIQNVFSSDESQGITGLVQEEDGVISAEFPDQSAEDPPENGLKEETGRSAGALQNNELKQFPLSNEQSFNEPLGKVEQGLSVIVMKVVGSGVSPDPRLQEDTLSLSSSTSLQDPREVIAEMSVKSVAASQVHNSDKNRKDELDLQDGENAV